MKAKKQKKLIDLPVTSIKVLDRVAKADGRKTKNLIERILIDYAAKVEPLENQQSLQTA